MKIFAQSPQSSRLPIWGAPPPPAAGFLAGGPPLTRLACGALSTSSESSSSLDPPSSSSAFASRCEAFAAAARFLARALTFFWAGV